MSDWTTIGTLAFGCFLLLFIGRRALSSRSPYPLPPGPPGIPFVGNVIGINTSAPWLTYADWARTYGDMVHSRLLGNDIITINSGKIAKDLLEKRSKNYSDRPHFVSNKLYGMDFTSSLLPYGDRWRIHRRFFHQTFRLDAVPRFLPFSHASACRLLRQLLYMPEQLEDHVFQHGLSSILKVTYGYDVSREDDITDIAANVLRVIIPAARPDVAIMLGAFPFLLHLPSWFPGMSFKRDMEMTSAATKVYVERPFEYSLRGMEIPSSSIEPSMVCDGLQIMQKKGTESDESWMVALKEAAGTALLAGSDTTHSVLMTFFLMMMLNPDVQEKAQAQIDAVVGQSRLPGSDDRPLLPFVDAILWETLRYNPVIPLSFPHVAVDDDVYDGFYIPKGAFVSANGWSIARDESRYPNPHAFIPERFLSEDGSLKPNDVEYITFGFGRRMCAGKHFADQSAWAVIVRVLAVFKILKPLDGNGAEITIEPKFSSGLIVHPLPFKCRIVPRFPGMDAEKLDMLIAASSA